MKVYIKPEVEEIRFTTVEELTVGDYAGSNPFPVNSSAI